MSPLEIEAASRSVEEMTQADFQALAKELGPFSVDRAGYVWAASAKGGRTVFANIRGWGYLTGKGDGALGLPDDVAMIEQRRWGALFERALNDFAAGTGPRCSTPARLEDGASSK